MEKTKPKAIKPQGKDNHQGVTIIDTTPEGDKLCPFKASQKNRECQKNCNLNVGGHCSFTLRKRYGEHEKKPLCPFFKRCVPTCAMYKDGACGMAATLNQEFSFIRGGKENE